VAGVVGIVATMPYRGMELTTPITSWVRAPCVGSPTPRRGLERGSVGARAQEGLARRNLRQRPRGRASRGLRPRPRGLASRCLRPSPGNHVWFALSFAIFIILIWVSIFMVPNMLT